MSSELDRGLNTLLLLYFDYFKSCHILLLNLSIYLPGCLPSKWSILAYQDILVLQGKFSVNNISD